MHSQPHEPCAPCHVEPATATAAPTRHQFDRLGNAQQAEVLARADVEHAIRWRAAWGHEHVMRTWRFIVLGLWVPMLLIALGIAAPVIIAFIAFSWAALAVGGLLALAAYGANQVSRTPGQIRADERRRDRRRARRADRRRRNAAMRHDFRVRGSAADLRKREEHLTEVSAKYERALLELWEAEQGMPLHAVYPIAGFPREF